MGSKKAKQVELPIEFTIPESLFTSFATNMVVQHEAGYFILAFYQVIPPILKGASDVEREKELAEISKVEGRCVARVVVPADKMESFISVQNQNWMKYQKSIMELSNETENGQ